MNHYTDHMGSLVIEYDYPTNDPKQFPKAAEPFTVIKPPRKRWQKPTTTEYIRVNLSLDIETTTVNGYSAPYIMSLSLESPGSNQFIIYHCRNWQAVQDLLDEIAKHYRCGHNRKTHTNRVLLCFIHNLSYEFYFCKSELSFDFGKWGFFSKESRKAMKAALTNGVEFRDSAALTNSNLVELSNKFTLHKKVKDLDYSVPRNTHTPMRDFEWRYINEDVIILNEFEDVFFSDFCMAGERPPLTNTARLLLKVKKHMAASNFDTNTVSLIQPSALTIIKEQRYLFRGGYVHGNINYLDERVRCLMRDITSSYPYAMLSKYYPMSPWVSIKLDLNCFTPDSIPEDFAEALKTKCCKYTVTFYNLRAKTEHTYESKSKVVEYMPHADDPTKGLDNGRIRRAEWVTVMQTELDWEIYTLLYDWDYVEIKGLQVSDRGQLPAFLLECLIEDYKQKNHLKATGKKKTKEYELKKADVNTYYGMLVKSVYSEYVSYNGKAEFWENQPQSYTAMQEELNERFLSYDWGIWVTAHARAKLVRVICAIERLGGHVIYYDTDSCKYIPSADGATERFFEEENKRIREENKRNPYMQGDAFYGKLGEGLGEWDSECDEAGVEFKTLGSKRYLYEENGHRCLCVAGLPKAAQDELDGEDAWERFSKYGFSFSGENTGKLRPVFHDEPYSVTITDNYGYTETIECKSGITLVPVDFQVSENSLAALFAQKHAFEKERRNYIA